MARPADATERSTLYPSGEVTTYSPTGTYPRQVPSASIRIDQDPSERASLESVKTAPTFGPQETAAAPNEFVWFEFHSVRASPEVGQVPATIWIRPVSNLATLMNESVVSP